MREEIVSTSIIHGHKNGQIILLHASLSFLILSRSTSTFTIVSPACFNKSSNRAPCLRSLLLCQTDHVINFLLFPIIGLAYQPSVCFTSQLLQEYEFLG